MPRLTARDFDPEVLLLFDQYVHGAITRRGFLDAAQRYAVGGMTAAGLLAALSPQFAEAQQVAPNDSRIRSRALSFPSPQGHGTVRGLLVQPAQAKGKLPTLLVVHENRGLNPHIEDVARRLALLDYVAFAPDALASVGGYPGDEDKAREMFGKLDQAKLNADFVVAAQALRTLPEGNGRVGVIGFCWGGGMVNLVATRVPELAAGVAFYGPAPPLADVPRIKAPLLLHFAGEDNNVNAGWPAYEAALKAAGVTYQAHLYPGVQHGFHNDTTPRYDADAAKLAWKRSIEFLDQRLRA